MLCMSAIITYLNVADSLNECPGKFMANLWQRVYALVKTSIGIEKQMANLDGYM